MNAHIVELDTSPHQRVQKLLPWAATGRLPETEARLVDEHVAGCAECQRDLAWERKVQAVQPAAGASPDMEAALARLLPQLEERPAAKPAGRTAANWMRWAMAAQLLLIAGLGTQLVRQHDAYRLLGVSGSGGANVVVVFRPETSERQLQSILESTHAYVVGGPTVTNAWLLNIPAAGVDHAIAALRAEGAVELAEPLQTEGPK